MPTETNPSATGSSILSQDNSHYMPALTGIRAIAAFMVCFHHYNPLLSFKDAGGWRGLAYGFFNEMHIGVSIFFVLSGFLICYRYYGSMATITRQWFKRYMMNRVARIYPMYILCTLLTFALIEYNPVRYEIIPMYGNLLAKERLSVFLLNVTMLKGFFNEYKFTGIAQGWSLTVEECFYLAAPFFMLSIRRSRWALVVLPILTLLFMLGLVFTIGRENIHGLFENVSFMLNYTFFGRCLEFFAGMALALFVLKQRSREPSGLSHRGIWKTFLGAALIGGCLLIMATISKGHDSKESLTGIFLNNALLPAIIVVLFYGLLTEKTWLRQLLSTKLFDTLGKSSYIFYLIHTGVINILLRTYLVHNSIIQFVLLNIISIALYKFIEQPFHRLLRPQTATLAVKAD